MKTVAGYHRSGVALSIFLIALSCNFGRRHLIDHALVASQPAGSRKIPRLAAPQSKRWPANIKPTSLRTFSFVTSSTAGAPTISTCGRNFVDCLPETCQSIRLHLRLHYFDCL
ncbi:phosphatidylinositol 4,5-biphosphate-dependent ARF1 GTPase-activating protein [Trichinella spiralis]|uniref:phosphatidylinositol 4,5-biphosphate-dependent ARF1 GTPase-activating protein n=1 Tax=Trichinella spiralis TaxID=6334 RepID=UPI0001EFCFF7|nr:phosphatidylinositol 4,5-biphosphate-dependent ARF1 GTPase-activating protein [Trichinella spiralis]